MNVLHLGRCPAVVATILLAVSALENLARAQNPPPGYKLVWSDEFNTTVCPTRPVGLRRWASSATTNRNITRHARPKTPGSKTACS